MGWSFAWPQGKGIGQEKFPCHTKWNRDGVRQNHTRREQRPHPLDSPRTIVIPTIYDVYYDWELTQLSLTHYSIDWDEDDH